MSILFVDIEKSITPFIKLAMALIKHMSVLFTDY